jgi:hypothetical protein
MNSLAIRRLFFFIACGACLPTASFISLLVQRKDPTPKNTAILLSHILNALIAMQNFVSALGVDYPTHCSGRKYL